MPDDIAAQVRARVASGAYVDESAVVTEALRTLQDRDQSVEEWLRTEVVEAYDALRADPSRARTADQVLDTLRGERERIERG